MSNVLSMILREDLEDYIRERINRLGFKGVKSFCEYAGISRSAFYTFITDRRGERTMLKVANRLQIHPRKLLASSTPGQRRYYGKKSQGCR